MAKILMEKEVIEGEELKTLLEELHKTNGKTHNAKEIYQQILTLPNFWRSSGSFGLGNSSIFSFCSIGTFDNRQAIYCLYGNDTYWLC